VSIPGTGAQLLIALLFVVPGAVYQAARSRLRGPSPADADATGRILRAIAVSAALNAVYLTLLGRRVIDLIVAIAGGNPGSWAGQARQAGLVALLLLFVVPAMLALLDYWRTRWTWLPRPLTYDPTPRAWDYAFTDRSPCFVRVLTHDQQWIGGYWGTGSFATSYPQDPELYLEQAWLLGPDGQFQAKQDSTEGLFVRCADVRALEFLAPTTGTQQGGGEDPDDKPTAGAPEPPPAVATRPVIVASDVDPDAPARRSGLRDGPAGGQLPPRWATLADQDKE
jgi:hypothetical protein